MSDKHQLDNEKLYKPDNEPGAEEARWTFLTPFVSLSLLSLPSLMVLAYGKQVAIFDLLQLTGVYTLVLVVLWVLIPLALVSGLIYFVRGDSRIAKSIAALTWAVVLVGFMYVVWPQ